MAIGIFLAGPFSIALMIVDGFNSILTGISIIAGLPAYCFKPSNNGRDNSHSFAEEAGSNFIGEVIVEGHF